MCWFYFLIFFKLGRFLPLQLQCEKKNNIKGMHRGSVYKYAQTGNLNGSYFWFGANVKSYLQLWYHGITWADSGSLFRVNHVSKYTSGAQEKNHMSEYCSPGSAGDSAKLGDDAQSSLSVCNLYWIFFPPQKCYSNLAMQFTLNKWSNRCRKINME